MVPELIAMAEVLTLSVKKLCSFSADNWTKSAQFNRSLEKRPSPDSLLDITARVAAANVPFQRVEETCSPLPEPILARIVYWSFPQNEQHIRMYSSFIPGSKCSADDGESVQLPFDRGVKLVESGAVEDVIQIGFHLVGTVKDTAADTSHTDTDNKFRVSVNFDRCKITSVNCTCDLRDIFWCQHVVALALYRIRHAESIQIRMPISETLQQMSREQLQKLAQYLIAAHTQVLPTAQKLADDIMITDSVINRLPGAPDPTAGGSLDDDNAWHLDEEQVQKLVKNYLSQGIYCNHNEQLSSIFDKVREMLRARDSNSERMLTLITDQFLTDTRLQLWRSQGIQVTDKCRQLWDEIGVLWVCIVLNPRNTETDRSGWQRKLKHWMELPVCPLEDGYNRPMSTAHGGTSQNADQPRTVFHRAYEALSMSWSDHHLHTILFDGGCDSSFMQSNSSTKVISERDNPGCYSSIRLNNSRGTSSQSHNAWCNLHYACNKHDSSGHLIWTENVPWACMRVEALRCHGFVTEAQRLAVAVARGIKHQQHLNLIGPNFFTTSSHISSRKDGLSSSSYSSRAITISPEGWVGHPVDPIGCLFSTLVDAAASSMHAAIDSKELPAVGNCFTSTCTCSHEHFQAPSVVSSEAYLSLAVEIALIGLGQHRQMPPGDYAQEKALKQEEKLISQLERLELTSHLLSVMRDQVVALLDGAASSGLSLRIHPESVPMHTFAKYLFNSLLSYDRDLAFRVGLRAMRLPVKDDRHEMIADISQVDNIAAADHIAAVPVNGSSLYGSNSHYSRWFTISHIESRQCDLAATMLYAARDEPIKLHSVLVAAQHYIHSSRQLFKLAQDAFKRAIPAGVSSTSTRCRPLLDAALELGLQVVRLTLTRPSWHRNEMVQWLVTCATELGYEALISLMKNWYNLFTPAEATTSVAMVIISPATLVHLDLDFVRQEELVQCARTLAMQCASKDAAGCALGALALCESSPSAFDNAYHIVASAAQHGTMTPTQLFAIARYLERRTHARRAHHIALLAMRGLSIAAGQDTHPALSDVRWACSLARSVGADELSSMLAALIENVHCATVLSDVLRRCAAPAEGKAGTILSFDRPPLASLLSAALAAYVSAAHARLAHISPRHYADFIQFLESAQHTFQLAADGPVRFTQLLDNMKLVYKGKKKLMLLITERFGP